MFVKLIETLKANPRTLVFTEGADARILEATARLKKDGFLTPILVGVEDEVKAAAAKGGYDIEGVRIVDPATYAGMDAMVEKMVELRKGKMSPEDCRKNLMKGNYFGTMLVKMGEADCLLGGATYSTADVIGTYVYRDGLMGGRFSYGTAVGIFTSMINFTLLFITNKISTKVADYGIW